MAKKKQSTKTVEWLLGKVFQGLKDDTLDAAAFWKDMQKLKPAIDPVELGADKALMTLGLAYYDREGELQYGRKRGRPFEK